MNTALFCICITGIVFVWLRVVYRAVIKPHSIRAQPEWWCPLCDGDHDPTTCPELLHEELPEQPNIFLQERARYYAGYFNERNDNEYSHN